MSWQPQVELTPREEFIMKRRQARRDTTRIKPPSGPVLDALLLEHSTVGPDGQASPASSPGDNLNILGEGLYISLLDGLLVEEEMADLTHGTVVVWLLTWLRAWVVARLGPEEPSPS